MESVLIEKNVYRIIKSNYGRYNYFVYGSCFNLAVNQYLNQVVFVSLQ